MRFYDPSQDELWVFLTEIVQAKIPIEFMGSLMNRIESEPSGRVNYDIAVISWDEPDDTGMTPVSIYW